MKHATGVIILSVFTLLFFTSCLGLNAPQMKTSYYTLEYDPPVSKTGRALEAVIRIDRLRMAPIYRSNKILFQEKSYQRDEYNYHKWRATPGDLVTYFLSRDFKASSLFKAVFSDNGTALSSHVIEGLVEDFFELDAEDAWYAVLTVSISLLAENSYNINEGALLQKRYSLREKCRQKNPRALAEAMSKAMAKLSGMIINDAYLAIAQKME